MMSEYKADDILISRFAEYLSIHPNLTAPHRHSFYHLLFFTEGAGTHTIDFEHFRVEPYQIYFMVPGQVHSWDFEGHVDGFVVNFSESYFKSFMLEPDYLSSFSFFQGIVRDSVINLSETIQHEILSCFKILIWQAERQMVLKDDMIRAKLLEIFINIEQNISATVHPQRKSTTNVILKNFHNLIELHFLTKRLPGEYADLLNITPNHLNALCKEHLGKQAGQLIRDRVTLEAKRLLVNMKLTVSEIAYKLNFNDNSYFTKFFKKEAGISPETFRKNATSGR